MNVADFFWYAVAASAIFCVLGFLILFKHADKTGEKLRRKRFMVRCAVEFVADGRKYTGTSNNCSLNGLFISTQASFQPGTTIEVSVHLPNGERSQIKGRIARVLKATNGSGMSLEEGIGIEIMRNEPNYLNFIKSLQETHTHRVKNNVSYAREY